jgi:hypothetical protein
MANVRLMPPANGLSSVTTPANGRSYTCASGSTIDVPDFDAFVLRANGWVNAAGGGATVSAVGATAARPANPSKQQTFHDTTLGKTIVFDGKTWRDPATGSAA